MKIQFSDPGMRDLMVHIATGQRGGVTHELKRQGELMNYTTAAIILEEQVILTLYRPLGSHSWQTNLPDPEER
jgi:hypothetical protein